MEYLSLTRYTVPPYSLFRVQAVDMITESDLIHALRTHESGRHLHSEVRL